MSYDAYTVEKLRDAAQKWAEEHPVLHTFDTNYGAALRDAAATIEDLLTVKWKKVNGRSKPKLGVPYWVCKSGWIYPIIAWIGKDGQFTSDGENRFEPEFYAEAVRPLMPKEDNNA